VAHAKVAIQQLEQREMIRDFPSKNAKAHGAEKVDRPLLKVSRLGEHEPTQNRERLEPKKGIERDQQMGPVGRDVYTTPRKFRSRLKKRATPSHSGKWHYAKPFLGSGLGNDFGMCERQTRKREYSSFSKRDGWRWVKKNVTW